MLVPARLSIVTLGVRDLGRSRAFYAALGWKEAPPSNERVAFFRTAGAVLALFSRESLAEDARIPVQGSGFGGVTLAVNVDTAPDVDASLAAAQTAGGTILKPAGAPPWGGRSGYFADPDGHPWEVAWQPAFHLDQEGRIVLSK